MWYLVGQDYGLLGAQSPYEMYLHVYHQEKGKEARVCRLPAPLVKGCSMGHLVPNILLL